MILILLFILFDITFADSIQNIIETKYGEIEGIIDEEAGVRKFLGIPFTDAPARFAPPGKLTPWKPKLFNATEVGPACWQGIDFMFPVRHMSEDCLHLNVVVPLEIKQNASLPVMVWIHGGAFKFGDGSDSIYDPSWLVANQNVIVVNINYRLSVFGFFYSETFATHDYPSTGTSLGLVDQMVAIEWVQENIANFGGDPDNIILFGESAGSLSICAHLISPISRKRLDIKGAIMESGACNGPWGNWGTKEQAKIQADNFLEKLNVTIEDLMIMDAKELANNPIAQPISAADGWFLPDTPPNMWKRRDYWKDIPILIGSNSFDGLSPSPFNIHGKVPATRSEMKSILREYFDDHIAGSLYNAYEIDTSTNVTNSFLHMNADSCVSCPTVALAQILQDTQSVWLYEFTLDNNAIHGEEIISIFHTPGTINLPMHYYENLANLMSLHWTQFAKSQKLFWPTVSKKDEAYMSYMTSSKVYHSYKQVKCALWNSLSLDENARFCAFNPPKR